MKEAVTKFDFESAFKALDEIEIPVAEKVRANRPALTEIFSRKTKFDSLMEEYYDINDTAELNDAKDAREAEVAKAKLARIEKIVDLEADSPEDLLTSYVGKYIIQCPQCMTLFYKDPEDVVEDEEDPSTVNVNEVCQHCGNESGYTLIGKVGEAEPDEMDNFDTDLAMPEEMPAEDASAEESTEEDLDIDLDAINLEDEEAPAEEEEEKKEESFAAHGGEALVEELADDKDLDSKLEAHSEYIEYLRTAIAQEEEKLEKATNEQVKVAIQRNIDVFKADLETALPDAVKNEIAEEENPAEEFVQENAEEEPAEEVEVQEESCETPVEGETLTEALHEEKDLDVSADEFEELINSPEFKKPISDAAVRDMINSEKENEEEVEESLTEAGIFDIAKAVGKKIGQAVKNKAGKVSAALDKFVNSAKTREEKADWLLANALESYDNAEFRNDGTVEAGGAKKRFNTFIVIGCKDTDVNGKKITTEPAFNSTKLVPGMDVPQEKTKYAEAEAIAKGWSQREGCGPAFIYLAKNAKDRKAVYLCKYFNGELGADDQLDTLFESAIADIAGNESMQQGGMDQSLTTKVKADAIKPGMKIKLPNGAEIEVVSVKKVTDAFGDEAYSITANNSEGKKLKAFSKAATYEFNVMKNSITANESLENIMSNLEELQESTLETLIADSLVESYGNVAGFRLAECGYNNNQFTVDGTIYFTSGNTRKTTYAFSEAFVNEGKICMRGLNEKLGLDKQFTLTGKIENNTLITESFTHIKK